MQQGGSVMNEPRPQSEDDRKVPIIDGEALAFPPPWEAGSLATGWGLTKRELFAFGAMQAILTGAVTRGCPAHEWIDQHMAVKCADALLKELAK